MLKISCFCFKILLGWRIDECRMAPSYSWVQQHAAVAHVTGVSFGNFAEGALPNFGGPKTLAEQCSHSQLQFG